MARKIVVEMGHETWRFPAHVVADSRAKYYGEQDEGPNYQEEYDYTLDDEGELFDWMSNNMDWKDVQPFAELIGTQSVDYKKVWTNATCWTEDE